MAKIVHLTTVHPADDVRIAVKECGSIADAGMEAVLIGRPPRTEGLGDVRVARHILPDANSRAYRLTVGMLSVLRRALRQNGDVYHFHDPELIGVGLALKVLGKRVVYDVHEDLPKQILSKPWIPGWLRPATAAVARATGWVGGRSFDAVVAATPDIAERFPASKTIAVQNFPSKKEFGGSNVLRSEPPARRAVAYVGGLYRTRGVAEMISALGQVAVDPAPVLVLAGPIGDPESQEAIRAAAEGPLVEYHEWLTRSEVRDLYGSVQAGLVVLHPEPRFMTSYPVKMFEYMAAGLPVIASDFPLWRTIIDDAKCGILVDPLDPAAIARAVEWVMLNPEEAEEMGERGRLAVESQYNWDVEARKLIALYHRLLPSE